MYVYFSLFLYIYIFASKFLYLSLYIYIYSFLLVLQQIGEFHESFGTGKHSECIGVKMDPSGTFATIPVKMGTSFETVDLVVDTGSTELIAHVLLRMVVLLSHRCRMVVLLSQNGGFIVAEWWFYCRRMWSYCRIVVDWWSNCRRMVVLLSHPHSHFFLIPFLRAFFFLISSCFVIVF